MGAKSKIEWTDASWNPIRARRGDKIGWFCVHESEGCRNCYAETMNRRLGTGIDYKAQNAARVEIFLDGKMLTAPLRWQRPRKVFVGSMTDLFGDFVPDEMIDRMFAVMALCPRHVFQILTKRPARMRDYITRLQRRIVAVWAGNTSIPKDGVTIPLPIWLGTSCEDQATADARIPHLLATPAAIRFLSCEPLLGPIDLADYLPQAATAALCALGEPARTVDWVICGGESGPHARPMQPEWARSLRDQCTAAAVPYFFKQWGEWLPFDQREAGQIRNSVALPRNDLAWRVGKKSAGRYLDGRTWDEVPP